MAPPDNKDGRRTKPSGRVRHEAGGRAVWEWAVESGRHALDSTSRLLKRLDIAHLRLLEDDEQTPEGSGERRKPDRPAPSKPAPLSVSDGPADRAGSPQDFDPYNSRRPPVRATARPAIPPKPAAPRITQPPRKLGLLARLFGRK